MIDFSISPELEGARQRAAAFIEEFVYPVQGQTRDERFRNFDGLVRGLVREALELAEQSGI